MLTDVESLGPRSEDTTDLLRRWGAGSGASGERAMERLYPELRCLAASLLRDQDPTLTPSDLLHDIYLRAARQRQIAWQDRAHFFALAARFGRRVLADHHRQRSRRRARERTAAAISGDDRRPTAPGPDLLALDQALERLGEVDPLSERIVELRFYGGLTVNETTAVLNMARATVTRRWRFARAWLARQLDERPHG